MAVMGEPEPSWGFSRGIFNSMSRRVRLINASKDDMRPGLVFETVVERLALGGDVIARAPDGRVVFCRGAAPGDTIRVRVTEVRKKFCRGEIVERTAGPDAVPPFCERYDECGGCPWQAVPAATQQDALKQHRRGLRNALKVDVDVAECASFGTAKAWRSAARLHWKNNQIGYHRSASRQLIDIPACPVLADPLPAMLTDVRRVVLGRLKGSGTIRLVGGVGRSSGTVEFRCHTDGQVPFVLGEALLKRPSIHGVAMVEPDGHREVFGVDQDILGPAQVPHPTGSFVQAHQVGNESLVERVLEACAGYGNILELYAGSGNFTIPLAQAGHSVRAVEIDGDAVERLNRELSHRGLSPGTVPWRDRPTRLSGAWDALILDPPRSGARRMLNNARGLSPETIIYVSCHPHHLFATLGFYIPTIGMSYLWNHLTSSLTRAMVRYWESLSAFDDMSRGIG